MYEKDFAMRLSKLRLQKGVSARDMSLSIGQNAGYINNIETGKALPSMHGFFYICEYLNVSPQEFFDMDSSQPEKIRLLDEKLKRLTPQQLDSVDTLVTAIVG
ncbi:MAG: helix-turn-helix domain-containing protein [Ruminococcus sp.]|nr:helix-turn-helix domain-containing protein [Ruminococcus sp.]